MFEKIIAMLEHMSFFGGVSVFAATIISVLLFMGYAEKKLPPDTEGEKLDFYWYFGLFITELYSQATSEVYLDFVDAIFVTAISVIGNILFFFICYGVLSLAGVDRENKFERCKKSFIGLVVVTFAILLLYDYLVGSV